MTPDDQPRIRPLGGEPAMPAPRHARGMWLAVAVGGIGVVAGLLIGIGIGSDPETPPTTGGTLSSLPPNLAGPGFVEPTTTTTTRPAPTTSTRADPQPPPTLAQMVPELDGTMLVALIGDGQGVLRWRLDEPEPRRFPLPPETDWVRFDAGGAWAAALTFPDTPLRAGAGMWIAGQDLTFQHFDSGVVSFAWHPTVGGRLAWTRSTLAGDLELWVGDFPGPIEAHQMVTKLGEPGAGDPLVLTAWGDWGFALAGVSPAGEEVLVTLDSGGSVLAESATHLVASSADGRLLISEQPRIGTGVLAGLQVAGPSLRDAQPLPWAVTDPTLWSADGLRVASVLETSVGALLQLSGETTFQSVLDTPFAEVLGWSPGDRFVVMKATGVRTRFSAEPALRAQREGRRPGLVFVDLADRSTSAIALAGTPVDIAFRVAS